MKSKITLSQHRAVNRLARFGYFLHTIMPDYIMVRREIDRSYNVENLLIITNKFLRINRRGKILL